LIKAIIFDLDNCLSSANEVGDALYGPAFDAIRRANQSTLSDAALNAAFVDIWRHPLDFVAKQHGFSEAMLAAGWQVFAQTEVQAPMRGYADLETLTNLPARRFLVTSGFRRLQESKIRALGFAGHFTAIHIDAIDEPDRKGKQGIFSEILDSYRLDREEVLIVGDNPDSEIDAGNRLGITTVQILRPGVPRCDNATHYIHGLADLKSFVMQDPTGTGATQK
jgi:FMN phosphatase YigB (HAD superfamily)